MDSFFIILSGRTKLTNIQANLHNFKKICNPGETLAEELLFTNNIKKKAL